ncbi:MAG: hypothetical protein J4O01_08345 [Chloroflexi bacterium]|nr:hypothetical protein [Chloroflexota bacterium]MCH8114461.1 hypothetical protein [Chloroflexota bacterium]MCI0775244.1 hypothetical protein [Chloroflexota bacterium]MCI0803585.1 hypothetical protein [Chloroflexota bacterium]MCI0808553.1 hypothetical protein [Chloroflexota bacterium]
MPTLTEQPRIAERIKELGHCIELVSIDPHFHDVTIGLFIKDGLMTIWSFSNREGIAGRIEEVRDRCTRLGDVIAVEGTTDQLKLTSDLYLDRALRFMFTFAVEKDPARELPTGRITAPDTKTKLVFVINGAEENGKYVYTISAEGRSDKAELRVRATVGGFVRYSDCERVDKNKFAFPDGKRYDSFARLILPLARNVSAVESQLAASELEGQMTTQTLGFSQS